MQTSFDAHCSASAPSHRFDEKSQTWISFKSETDALFSSFWLGEQLGDEPLVPIAAISAILTLLKNPEFHASQLSYNTGLDVLTNIAVNRHKTALTRSIVHSKEGQIVNHSVIGDLVAQEIGKNGILYYSEIDALKEMCLVHRSWTIPARRVLSRSAVLSGRAGLYKALRNPYFGPSARLCYYGDWDSRETRQLLSAVLKRCPGLRHLQLSYVLDYKDQQLFEDISNLQNLEKLELGLDDIYKESASLLLMDVCLALPRMESLKSLTLYGVVCRPEERFPSSLHESSPCSRLTEVNLRGYYAEEYPEYPETSYHRHEESLANIDFISWIFKPRQDYKVTSTTVNTRDIYEVGEDNTSLNDLGIVLLSAFPGIQTLEIDTDDGGADYDQVEDLKSRFAKIKSEV